MPRKKKPSPPDWLPADAATWFGVPRRGPQRPGLDHEILDFIRETSDPSELCEGTYIEPEHEKQGIGTLPLTPDYIQPLDKIDLSGEEWRTIVLHVMRRLAMRRSDWAQVYARDIEIFAALKGVQSLGDTEHPGYMDPAVLAVRLENDCSIISEPTKTGDMYLQYVVIRNALVSAPKKAWTETLERVYRDDAAGPLYLTPEQQREILKHQRTAEHVALNAVANLLGRDPETLANQFRNAGLPLRLIGPSKQKAKEMRSLPIRKISAKMRSRR
jgi:hypothetical protein